jgi:hypothetical protein
MSEQEQEDQMYKERDRIMAEEEELEEELCCLATPIDSI